MRFLKKWYRQIDKVFLAVNLVAFVFFLLATFLHYRLHFSSGLFPDSNSFDYGVLAGASVFFGGHVVSTLLWGLVRVLDNRSDNQSLDQEG